MKQITDKLNDIAKAIDESVELPTSDLIVDSLDAITKAFGGTPSESGLIVDKLDDIAKVATGGMELHPVTVNIVFDGVTTVYSMSMNYINGNNELVTENCKANKTIVAYSPAKSAMGIYRAVPRLVNVVVPKQWIQAEYVITATSTGGNALFFYDANDVNANKNGVITYYNVSSSDMDSLAITITISPAQNDA